MKAARKEGAVAKIREDKKVKYSGEQLPGGERPCCIALVCEHFGHWGGEAGEFLKQLCKRARLTEWSMNGQNFRAGFLQLLEESIFRPSTTDRAMPE